MKLLTKQVLLYCTLIICINACKEKKKTVDELIVGKWSPIPTPKNQNKDSLAWNFYKDKTAAFSARFNNKDTILFNAKYELINDGKYINLTEENNNKTDKVEILSITSDKLVLHFNKVEGLDDVVQDITLKRVDE